MKTTEDSLTGEGRKEAQGFAEEPDKGRRILEAAMAIFSSKPYHQVKVEDIAALAGVGKGTVYEYYRSKEDLFGAVFDEGGRIYLREMEGALGREGTAVEKFTHLIATHIAFISHNRPRAILMAAEHRLMAPRELRQAFMERRSRLLSLVRETILQGVQEGSFRPVDVDVASLFVIGGIISLWTLALSEDQGHLQSRGQEVVSLVLQGLGRGQA
jgi:AcrR family transcriptional regulator